MKKGTKHSRESKRKNSESNKGRIPWNKGIKSPHTPYWLGKKRPKLGAKISAKLKGRKKSKEYVESQLERLREQAKNARSKITKKSYKKGGEKRKGRKFSIKTRKKMSLASKGQKSYLWKGGITSTNRKIRSSLEYKLWRESVFKRDNYTCRKCGQYGEKLEADHILPFAYFPSMRTEKANGITLCKECHKNTVTHGHKAKRFFKYIGVMDTKGNIKKEFQL